MYDPDVAKQISWVLGYANLFLGGACLLFGLLALGGRAGRNIIFKKANLSDQQHAEIAKATAKYFLLWSGPVVAFGAMLIYMPHFMIDKWHMFVGLIPPMTIVIPIILAMGTTRKILSGS